MEKNKMAILVRNQVYSTCIRGVMIVEGMLWYTLEPSWKNNQSNTSCIPCGEYMSKYLEKSVSGKYKNIYHVTNVQNREGILVHNGNIVDHTHGCILIGYKRTTMAGKPAIIQSRVALYDFVKYMGKESFLLKIIGNQTFEAEAREAV